jgi:hypothetical protein
MRAQDRDSIAFGGAKCCFPGAKIGAFLLFLTGKPETSENERKS